jgi:chromosome partitioning protein
VIVVIGSCKGGSGKTTTCVNLSIGLSMKGFDVALVGADKQGTANRFHDRREAAGFAPLVTVVRKNGNLVNTLTSLNAKYDHVLSAPTTAPN